MPYPRNPKSGSRNPKWLLAAALAVCAAPLLALDLSPPASDPSVFQARRERLMAALPPKSVVVLRSAPERIMTNDVEYLYRQDSDFFYLTGIPEDDVTAVLRPDAPDGKRYVLFLRPRDPRGEAWHGARVGPDEAAAAYGAQAAFPSKDLSPKLWELDASGRNVSGYMAGIERLYLRDGSDEAWAEKFRQEYAEMRQKDRGPATIVDARGLIHAMRLVKDEEELRLLRRAAELSAQGHIRAMQAARPERWEFEVQAALDGYCYANGARRMAYPSIAGSGPNSCVLHYDRSNRQMKDGEVLLNDSGTEYGMYATDITRTYPVNGRFSPEQRAIYEIVLDAQRRAIALVRPGLPHDEIEKKAAMVQAEGLVRLGLLAGDPAAIVKSLGHRRFTLHSVSHWVGLDVHDVGSYVEAGKPRLLEPGMVLTIEPGIYIAAGSQGVDPKWWNIGVRIEDTVLVTKDGSECLSCAAPREIADVERTVQAGRK